MYVQINREDRETVGEERARRSTVCAGHVTAAVSQTDARPQYNAVTTRGHGHGHGHGSANPRHAIRAHNAVSLH